MSSALISATMRALTFVTSSTWARPPSAAEVLMRLMWSCVAILGWA